jgi:hypothetical protein
MSKNFLIVAIGALVLIVGPTLLGLDLVHVQSIGGKEEQ